MKKILVIEDDNSIRTNLRILLELNGFKIFTADNGKEGIQLASAILPDLIISDIMMPETDGYSVKKELDLNERTNGIPFIFLTAKAEMKDLRKGMELGADDYIVKPFKGKELINTIKTRLQRINSVSNKVYSEAEKNTDNKNKLKEKDRILITVNSKPQFIKVADIEAVSAMAEYTKVYLTDKKLTVRKLLKEWEETLPENKFIRIHRSTIINIDAIEKVEKWYKRSYAVFIRNNKKPFTISERYMVKLKSLFAL